METAEHSDKMHEHSLLYQANKKVWEVKQMNVFPEIKNKFGFGCMRLPMIGNDVDIEQFKKMADYFIENGFNYFDTAHGYLDGKSETAIKEALTSRYPRQSYILTDKLTGVYFTKEEDVRPFFLNQL